jgi:hypothetical protein
VKVYQKKRGWGMEKRGDEGLGGIGALRKRKSQQEAVTK